MTESEWQKHTDPQKMLDFLRGKASKRKLRLFACACCRRAWHLLNDERSQNAVVTAERFADGLAGDKELAKARQAAKKAQYPQHGPESGYYLHESFNEVARTDRAFRPHVVSFFMAFALTPSGGNREEEAKGQVQMLRCIVGNPFHPTTFDPAWTAWNDGTVVKIAQAIYDERRFDDLPILADALEDAGCDSEDILNHCRGPGPHVRGCWVIDLQLGKE